MRSQNSNLTPPYRIWVPHTSTSFCFTILAAFRASAVTSSLLDHGKKGPARRYHAIPSAHSLSVVVVESNLWHIRSWKALEELHDELKIRAIGVSISLQSCCVLNCRWYLPASTCKRISRLYLFSMWYQSDPAPLCSLDLLKHSPMLQVSNFNKEELEELVALARIKPSVVQR